MKFISDLNKSTQLLVILGSTAMAGIIFMVYSTTPERAGITGVAAIFILIYLVSFVIFELVLRALKVRKQEESSTNLYVSAIMAFLFPMVLALQTLGQLHIRDIAIVLFLIAVMLFYWSRK